MARRNRRDDEFADDRLDDDVFDDDEDAGDDEADADDVETEPVSRGGTVTRARRRDAVTRARPDTARVGIFGRIARFFREVVAELRKVIWPTRKELLTYTAVVIVFVSLMLAVVGLLDLAFAKGVLWVFGN